MSEFFFKNLSVKLFSEERACDIDASRLGCVWDCSVVLSVDCGWCTEVHPSLPPCNLNCSFELSCGMYCTAPYTYKYVKASPLRVPTPVELGALKEQLRKRLAEVEAAEQRLEAARKPRTVEEIDQLKAQLLAAVAELDEQRGRMEGGQGPS